RIGSTCRRSLPFRRRSCRSSTRRWAIEGCDSSLVQLVQFSVFSLDIAQEWFGVETDARYPLGEIVGGEHAAPPMNYLAQPPAQADQLSRCDFIFDVGDLEFRLLVKLHGIQIP